MQPRSAYANVKGLNLMLLCALLSGLAAPAAPEAGVLGNLRRAVTESVPASLIPTSVWVEIAQAEATIATLDATVTATRYQFSEAMVTKDRAVALGHDLSSVVRGDWGSIFGTNSEVAAAADDLDLKLPALVVHAASAGSTMFEASGSDDPLQAAVQGWLESRGVDAATDQMVLTRKASESAAKFKARVARAQAALDQKLANADDLEQVLTITGLPVTVGKADGDHLPMTVKAGLMSLTPTGLYGFDFARLGDEQCSKFVSAGEGMMLVVCGNGSSRKRIEKLAAAHASGSQGLTAEIDVTIAAMAEMMPRAHEALMRSAQASLEGAEDDSSAALLALPAIHIRALRIKAGNETLMVRQPYFINELMAGNPGQE